MPEYLAPGVYVEETSFRNKTIEGVSTSTAAFIGPTRFGPAEGAPELLTSYSDFERIYGGIDPLQYDTGTLPNYMAHAVRSFFEEGGSRLYVQRVFLEKAGGDKGIATKAVPDSGDQLTFKARYPGKGGEMTVTITFKLGPNVLARKATDVTAASPTYLPTLQGVSPGDVVWVKKDPAATDQAFYVVEASTTEASGFQLKDSTGAAPAAIQLGTLYSDAQSTDTPTASVRPVTLNVTVTMPGKFGQSQTWQGVTFDPTQSRSLANVFPAKTESRATALYNPLVVDPGSALASANGAKIAERLAEMKPLSQSTTAPKILDALKLADPSELDLSFRTALGSGNDGQRPKATDYAGKAPAAAAAGTLKTGLKALEDIEDISIVAAPGSTAPNKAGDVAYKSDTVQVTINLLAHCERMRYRVAVLDSMPGMMVSDIQAYRGQFDSKYAALYYPWVRVMDPFTEQPINLPPSGFVAGIYARNDVNEGVFKAPANEVVHSTGLELMLNKAQQDVLNPLGINCFRFFEGRGYRLWGARTISSDPEWKYVNVRRFFNYLERSIDKGTQWAVFMNNNEPLWGNIKSTIEDFLYSEWKRGALMGSKPEEAYFVRCDRSTMTQNDIDNGRLICLVGVAPVKPAEFVIFRIGQWTADSQG